MLVSWYSLLFLLSKTWARSLRSTRATRQFLSRCDEGLGFRAWEVYLVQALRRKSPASCSENVHFCAYTIFGQLDAETFAMGLSEVLPGLFRARRGCLRLFYDWVCKASIRIVLLASSGGAKFQKVLANLVCWLCSTGLPSTVCAQTARTTTLPRAWSPVLSY